MSESCVDAGVCDYSVISSSNLFIVYECLVFIFCLPEVVHGFVRGSVCRDVLVVVVALFEQYRGLITFLVVVILHEAVGGELSIAPFAVHVHRLGQAWGLQGEVYNNVFRLCAVALLICGSRIEGTVSVFVGKIAVWNLVHPQCGMVVRLKPTHVVYIHAGVVDIEDFELVVLVAGREYKLFAVLPLQAVGLVDVRTYAGDGARGTAVLTYYGVNLAVGVANPDAAIVQT